MSADDPSLLLSQSEHDEEVVTVALTRYQCRGLRVAAMLGGPPPSDPDPALSAAIRALGEAETS